MSENKMSSSQQDAKDTTNKLPDKMSIQDYLLVRHAVDSDVRCIQQYAKTGNANSIFHDCNRAVVSKMWEEDNKNEHVSQKLAYNGLSAVVCNTYRPSQLTKCLFDFDCVYAIENCGQCELSAEVSLRKRSYTRVENSVESLPAVCVAPGATDWLFDGLPIFSRHYRYGVASVCLTCPATGKRITDDKCVVKIYGSFMHKMVKNVYTSPKFTPKLLNKNNGRIYHIFWPYGFPHMSQIVFRPDISVSEKDTAEDLKTYIGVFVSSEPLQSTPQFAKPVLVQMRALEQQTETELDYTPVRTVVQSDIEIIKRRMERCNEVKNKTALELPFTEDDQIMYNCDKKTCVSKLSTEQQSVVVCNTYTLDEAQNVFKFDCVYAIQNTSDHNVGVYISFGDMVLYKALSPGEMEWLCEGMPLISSSFRFNPVFVEFVGPVGGDPIYHDNNPNFLFYGKPMDKIPHYGVNLYGAYWNNDILRISDAQSKKGVQYNVCFRHGIIKTIGTFCSTYDAETDTNTVSRVDSEKSDVVKQQMAVYTGLFEPKWWW